jgi:N-acetylglucosamine kinase-like BadF-type ATPase
MLYDELLLSIDIGSSSCKAAVFTPTGECLADAKARSRSTRQKTARESASTIPTPG